MAHFEYSSLVKAPREKVFEFSCIAQNLIDVMPPDYKIDLVVPVTHFKKGLEYDVRVSRYGISVLWGVQIEELVENEFYRDRQTHGPFSMWLHTHQFEDHSQGTVVKDKIEYDLAFGLFGKLALDIYVKRELERFITYRHTKMQEMLSRRWTAEPK